MDVAAIRHEFPHFDRADAPVYLDSACMSLKPRSVIDAVTRYYTETPYCAGRAVYEGSRAVGAMVDGARGALASFLGAASSHVLWTKNATESINLVAQSFPWEKGDVVLTSDREHNSNLVPWQRLRETHGVRHEVVASAKDGTLDLEAWKERLGRGDVRFVAAVHVSNLDGYVAPARDLVDVAHANGAQVLLDGAQAAPHVPVDLARIGADHYAISLHKMLAPTGVGALISKGEALAALSPFIVGGDTVARTTYAGAEFLEAPAKFEAGLQNYAGIAGVEPALALLSGIGMQAVEAHGRSLARRAHERLERVPGLHLVGAPISQRVGIVPFSLDKIDPHALAILLEDKHGIFVRSGDHCLHSWFNARGVPGAVRMSTHVYSTQREVDMFGEAVASLLARLA